MLPALLAVLVSASPALIVAVLKLADKTTAVARRVRAAVRWSRTTVDESADESMAVVADPLAADFAAWTKELREESHG